MVDERLLAVCMPVYNNEEHLDKSIGSILEQSFENFTFFICDDASSDNTINKIKSYNDPRIQLICNDENLGSVKSRNKLIDIAINQGFKYMALMDGDDECFPKRFQRQIEILENDPSIDIVGGGAISTRIKSYWGVSDESFSCKIDCLFYNPFPTPSVIIRLESLERTQTRFRDEYRPCADYKFFVEMLVENNVRAIGINEPLIKYIFNPSSVSNIDGRKGQIKMDKKIKAELLNYLGVKLVSGDEDLYHDICFRIRKLGISQKMVSRFFLISAELIDANLKETKFDHSNLLYRLNQRIKWCQQNMLS